MYFRIPFAGLISFFAIYMGIAENKSLSRFVRFNGMQVGRRSWISLSLSSSFRCSGLRGHSASYDRLGLGW